MKAVLRRMDYPDNRDEWHLYFGLSVEEKHEFQSIKDELYLLLPNSKIAYATDKTSIHAFISDPKEYTIANLKWL